MALFSDDLPIFFDTDEHAVTATVTPLNGDPAFTLVGILEDLVMYGNEYTSEVREDSSKFTTRTGLISGLVTKRDTLSYNSQSYEVIDFDVNTSGVTGIIIERRPKQAVS